MTAWSSTRRAFQRDRMTDPAAYYAREGLTLVGRGEWRSARCPFHDDKNPSLRVRVESGSFRCMTCGAHGGDVVSFHQQKYQQTFKQAAQELGAWGTGR